MAREQEVIPLGWGDTEVPLHSYVAFYYTTGEALRRSLAFLRAGLDEPGTFCMFLAEEARIGAFLCGLQDGYAGDIAERQVSRKLVAAAWRPDFDSMADTMLGRIDDALEEGYVRIRAMGLVAWDAVGWGDHEWLKRCESRINLAAAMYPMVILCTYSLPPLPGLIATEHDDPEQPEIVVNDTMATVPAGVARAAMSMSRRLRRRHVR